jgi:hypothetical protein
LLRIHRSSGGQVEALLLTQAGQKRAAQLTSSCE